MEHDFETRDGGLTIKVSGRMTHKDHKAFREILNQIGISGTMRVRFDLSRVEFMDSSALGMLLIVRDAAVQQQRDVVLKGATGQVENLIKVAKLHKYFTVE
jgi:anti-anti-sigma factor